MFRDLQHVFMVKGNFCSGFIFNHKMDGDGVKPGFSGFLLPQAPSSYFVILQQHSAQGT